MSKAAIEAGARACEKYLGNRADLAAPINHEDLSVAIVIAFLRALLAEGPSEEEVETVARALCKRGGSDPDEKCYEGSIAGPREEWKFRLLWTFSIAEARAAIAADRAQLIAEIEGK